MGQKLPNPWGLYDMHGNVMEWCWDGLREYAGGIAVDPQGPVTDEFHVMRGGSVDPEDWNYRSASRFGQYWYCAYEALGFRVVLAPGGP